MSELLDKKMKFVKLLPRLLDYIYESGYQATLGDTQRSWAGKMDFELAVSGLPIEYKAGFDRVRRKVFYGSEVSLHRSGLAVDINLFAKMNGIWTYLTKTTDHAPFGYFWMQLDEECEWGGKGDRSDGNHYSIRYKGRW